MEEPVYAGIDTGGTNVRVYTVNSLTGELDLENPLLAIKAEKVESNEHLTALIKSSLKPLGSPQNVRIGAASAGKVDEENRIIESSPNFPIRGNITYPRDLQEAGYDTTVTNDMRAALLGAMKYGAGKGLEKVIIATFSSGHNYAAWIDGKISERLIEFGHEAYKPGSGIFCGCGGEGHLEPYVSGNGARAMAMQALLMKGVPDHTILREIARKNPKEKSEMYDDNDPDYQRKLERLKQDQAYRTKILADTDARAVFSAYRKNPDENPQRDIRDIQVQAIAVAIGHMISQNGNLDKLICMGSQTKDWDVLFQPAIDLLNAKPDNYHLPNLALPPVVKNDVKKIGVKGAVAYYLYRQEQRGIAA